MIRQTLADAMRSPLAAGLREEIERLTRERDCARRTRGLAQAEANRQLERARSAELEVKQLRAENERLTFDTCPTCRGIGKLPDKEES